MVSGTKNFKDKLYFKDKKEKECLKRALKIILEKANKVHLRQNMGRFSC